MEGWDNSKPKTPANPIKKRKPNDLSYRSLVSTKGLTQVVKPTAAEVRQINFSRLIPNRARATVGMRFTSTAHQ